MSEYRASLYNVILTGADEGTAVFNTLTGALTSFEASEWQDVAHLLTSPGTVADIRSSLLESLVAQGHLVATVVDERQLVLARKRAGIADANRLDVVVMPTLDCNFRCVYCFEEHRPSRMSSDVVAALTEYLRREIPRFKGIMLHWYGGEPLLQLETVLEISKCAVQVARLANVLITVQMTTNGYSMGADVSRALVDAGLREFQVTIDGTRAYHDALRPNRSGVGTFDQVLENTVQLLRTDSTVQVAVRVNFNHTNCGAIAGLFDEFDADLRPRVRFVFEPIFGSCDVRARSNIKDAAISAMMTELHGQAAAAGYATSVSGVHAGKLVYCYAEREHQVIVGPDGSIYKCGVSQFEDSDAVGVLKQDGTIERLTGWDYWTGDPVLEESCLDCAYVPLCMGGCRKERASGGTGGDTCALVPQNVSSVLKTIALEGHNGLAPLLGLSISGKSGGTV